MQDDPNSRETALGIQELKMEFDWLPSDTWFRMKSSINVDHTLDQGVHLKKYVVGLCVLCFANFQTELVPEN